MKILTIIYGILLTLLGAGFYYVTSLAGDSQAFPLIAGILIIAFGILQGRWEHKHPLYGSILLSLIVLVGYLFRLFRIFVIGSETTDLKIDFTVHTIIAVSAVIFVVLSIFLIKDFWQNWKAFGQFIGDWLARVVLTIFYFTILVPFGLGVRLFADPLQIKKLPNPYWCPRTTGDQKIDDVLRQG
jgi:hypothetical protein